MSHLVVNNRITEEGISVYWRVVDAAVKFNVTEHRQCVIKQSFEELKCERDESIQKTRTASS